MDLATLALTAYTFTKPFLEKTQEGVARKLGEDIWNLIKKPFAKKGDTQVEELAIQRPDQFTSELTRELQNDPHLVQSLTNLVNEAQKLVSSNDQQNIMSFGEIEKQVNIQNVNGNVSL